MHGVAARRRGALDDVVLPATADDDRTQTHPGPAGAVDEDAGEQAPDASEAVEDDVADALIVGGLRTDDLVELSGEEIGGRGRLLVELDDEATEIDPGRAEVEVGESADDLERGLDVELLAEEVTGIAVSLDHAGHGLALRRTPEEGEEHVVVAVEAADERDEVFSRSLLLRPLVETSCGCVSQRSSPLYSID